MEKTTAVAAAFGIGVDGGLRSMTAPAVVAWAARMGILQLEDSPLAFMGSNWAVGFFTLAAVGEYVADLLPNTPPRTAPLGLGARVVSGGLCGACVGTRSDSSRAGAIAGALGAVAGAFAGYHARRGLVNSLKVEDAVVAIPEDLAAIGLGLWLMSQM